MEQVSTCGVLLPFVIGYGGPTVYLLFAMGYQLCYDFDNVISRAGGVTNVFTSISRATSTMPWSMGWIIAMFIHLVFNLSIYDDFTRFWWARRKLLPPEERDAYLDLVARARDGLWMRAIALVLVSFFMVSISQPLHFAFVAFYFCTDAFYLRAVDFLEEDLARRKDSTAIYLRFHHRTANWAMKALGVGIVLSWALHSLAAVSYAHSMFGFLELLYGGCHGWHELVTTAIIVAGGRAELHLSPEPPEHEPPEHEPPEREAADGADPKEAPQGVHRSRRLQRLPPEFEPLP
ncbi:uncharacterized protein LOC119371981 [Rhipicephalus sanguineus]|uniref:uncharacterized protein LOC119371981 n=1 Tax=Rhipicephalus sanguineus TaxID=34632 RepID=UPI001893CB18|nr:uncharacterized protein LOC119371981 [Rhipicephalus sanguineus]